MGPCWYDRSLPSSPKKCVMVHIFVDYEILSCHGLPISIRPRHSSFIQPLTLCSSIRRPPRWLRLGLAPLGSVAILLLLPDLLSFALYHMFLICVAPGVPSFGVITTCFLRVSFDAVAVPLSILLLWVSCHLLLQPRSWKLPVSLCWTQGWGVLVCPWPTSFL